MKQCQSEGESVIGHLHSQNQTDRPHVCYSLYKPRAIDHKALPILEDQEDTSHKMFKLVSIILNSIILFSFDYTFDFLVWKWTTSGEFYVPTKRHSRMNFVYRQVEVIAAVGSYAKVLNGPKNLRILN